VNFVRKNILSAKLQKRHKGIPKPVSGYSSYSAHSSCEKMKSYISSCEKENNPYGEVLKKRAITYSDLGKKKMSHSYVDKSFDMATSKP
jgi:hypothetical protein